MQWKYSGKKNIESFYTHKGTLVASGASSDDARGQRITSEEFFRRIRMCRMCAFMLNIEADVQCVTKQIE